MNTISFSLSLLHLEDSSSDCGKNAEYSKEDPVTEEIKFWKFRELPVEVRLMIWKEVCFKPRIIDIWGKSIRSLWPFGDDTWFEADIFPYPPVRPFVYRSYSRIPSILHVSREARNAGLKHYSLEFGTSWSLWHSTSDTRNIYIYRGQIYVNWSCDVIFPITYHPNPTLMWERLHKMEPQFQNVILADYTIGRHPFDPKHISLQKMNAAFQIPGFSLFRLRSTCNCHGKYGP
jgi:hypothetical protein